MSDPQSKEQLCRIVGCEKPRIEGWMLCDAHAQDTDLKCSHGNPIKSCTECMVEWLREPGATAMYALPQGDLLALTLTLDNHPDWWDHPCWCAECRSYADD